MSAYELEGLIGVHQSSLNGCRRNCRRCKLENKHPAIALLLRGLECGVFADAPAYQYDVENYLRTVK